MLALILALLARLAPFATRQLRIPAVRRDLRAPVVIGHRGNGRPIYAIGGADDAPTTTLEEQRTALLARLEDPDLSPEDRAAAITEAGELTARIQAHNQAVADAEAARTALLGEQPVVRSSGAPGGQGGAGGAGGARTPAELARQDQLQAEQRETMGQTFQRLNGEVGMTRAYIEQGARGVSRTVTIPGDVRALFATTNNPMNFPRVPGTVIQNDQALQVLDLVDRQPMSGTSIEWVQETTPPNAAAEVAEGGAKPEATFTLTLVTDTAATIAHWVSITRQALDDDTMLRGYVEGRLTYGLQKRLNGQIVNGNGTAPNLRGILNVAGIGTYTAGTATEAAIISVRKAKTVAQLSEYDPDSVVMNPVDWEAIELSTDTQGTFRVIPNVQAGAAPRIWGLNVVSTTAITGTVFGTTGGTFLVGAFRTGCTLWERTGVDIYITDSHASTFINNILTLLAEIRAALTCWRPKAFVKGTFGASRT